MSRAFLIVAGLGAGAAGPLAGQTTPTSQPGVVHITRELEKPGHFGAHEATEARWAALNRRHNFPHTYIALSAVSGTPEVWWITPYPDLATMGKGSTFGAGNGAYQSALSRLAVEDGEHLNGMNSLQAVAVPAASSGPFPDVAKIRVYSILTVQVRPGMDQAFTEIAQAYGAILRKGGVDASWRAYQVIAGMPSGTFLVFTSYPSWDAVQAQEQASEAAFARAAPADLEDLTRRFREAIVSSTNRYFNVNPAMSYPSKEMIAADSFWAPRPATARQP